MTRTSRDETFCGICGHLLTRAMSAAEFDGQFIDYVDREAYDWLKKAGEMSDDL